MVSIGIFITLIYLDYSYNQGLVHGKPVLFI